MFGAIAGGIASALAGGAMSKLFGGGQKAASGGIQGDVLATDNNTVGMGDAGRSEERFGIPAEPLFRSTSITHAYSIVIGGIQGDVLATDNNTVGMGDAGIKSAIQGSNVPNPDERSEERRVGKECRYRGWPGHCKKIKKKWRIECEVGEQ